MITLFLLFSAFMIIGTILPFLFKLLFAILAFIFEIMGFMFLFSMIGIVGIVLFFALDFVVLKLLMKVFLI